MSRFFSDLIWVTWTRFPSFCCCSTFDSSSKAIRFVTVVFIVDVDVSVDVIVVVVVVPGVLQLGLWRRWEKLRLEMMGKVPLEHIRWRQQQRWLVLIFDNFISDFFHCVIPCWFWISPISTKQVRQQTFIDYGDLRCNLQHLSEGTSRADASYCLLKEPRFEPAPSPLTNVQGSARSESSNWFH